MSENEEMQQEASLELYKSQISQVEQAIQAAGESPDLAQLRNDLQELISLTEEHLLELKKARLLKSLGDPDFDEPDTSEDQQTSNVDDEYTVFQAALSEELKVSASHSSLPSSSNNVSRNDSDYDSSGDEDNGEGQQHSSTDYSQLIGTKCRAPFSHDYGGFHYGNAMIWSVDSPAENDDEATYKVRVVFINPTHPSMIPCKYFLDGNCRFSDGECRRSHGHPVLVSDLKAFEEPDHSKIIEGCRCLAKNSDDVWHPATVIDVCDDHLVNVRFDSQQMECTVQVEHIVPLDDDSDDEESSSSEDEGGTSGLLKGSDDSDGDLPVYLWKPAQTTDKLGAWERHTKGIGSKLMAKMGYITGQGLGPQGDGRAEPVPIMLLPQGKSLDKIMQLKEMSGNTDMFNAMKKLEKRQKVLEKKETEKDKQRQIRQNTGLFGFINRKLGEEKEQAEEHRRPGKDTGKVLQSSERDLTHKSDTEVNVQIFKTAEEMKKVERSLDHLKQQLVRNESRDRKMADKVRQKITEQEGYLRQLKSSSQTLETHKERRTAHKKLTVF